jgi:anti-anti-sigma regulatory factor
MGLSKSAVRSVKSAVQPSQEAAAPVMKRLGRVAVLRADGAVERDALEACDYMLREAGDAIGGAILDLTHAHHIDYRAIPILVSRRRVLRAKGKELAVVAARSDVRLIVRASAGSEVPVFQTRDEAMAWVQGEAGPVVGATAARGKTRPRLVRSAGH